MLRLSREEVCLERGLHLSCGIGSEVLPEVSWESPAWTLGPVSSLVNGASCPIYLSSLGSQYLARWSGCTGSRQAGILCPAMNDNSSSQVPFPLACGVSSCVLGTPGRGRRKGSSAQKRLELGFHSGEPWVPPGFPQPLHQMSL